MENRNGKKRPGISGKRLMAGFLALAMILAILCGALMSRRSETATVKVRYDGQTYIGDGDGQASGSGHNYGWDGYGWGEKNIMTVAGGASADVDIVYSDAMAPDMAAPAESDGWYGGDAQDDNTATAHGKKLVWSYEYSAETAGYDASMAELQAWLDGNGGYIESIDTDKRDWDTLDGKSSNTVRKTYLSLRVPAGDAAGMPGTLSRFGFEVTRENARMSDRTQAYADAELQKAAYEAEYATLLALLPQAQNVTETIEIQDRLSSLNYMIQSYGKQMELIDADVDLSRVTLTLYEVKYYEATIQKFRLEMGERMADALEDFLYYLPEFLFVLVYIAVIGLLVVGLATLFVRGAFRLRGRSGPQVIEIKDSRGPAHDTASKNKDVQT